MTLAGVRLIFTWGVNAPGRRCSDTDYRLRRQSGPQHEINSDERLHGIVPDDDETLQHLAGHTSTALELGEPPSALFGPIRDDHGN